MKHWLISLLSILMLFSSLNLHADSTQESKKQSSEIGSFTNLMQIILSKKEQPELLNKPKKLREEQAELFSNSKGVLIIEIIPDGQAEKAGLQFGDILLSYDAVPIQSRKHLIKLIRNKPKNGSVELVYLRNSSQQTVSIKGGRMGLHTQSLVSSQPELLTTKMNHLMKKGNNSYKKSNYYTAKQSFEAGFEIAKSTKKSSWQAAFLSELGLVYYELNQYSQALKYHQQSLEIRRKLSSRAGEAYSLRNIGLVYSSQRQFTTALEYHQQALRIKRELANQAGEATSLNDLGNVYKKLHQYERALKHYQQSLKLLQKLGDRDNEAVLLVNLGNVHTSLSQYPQALEQYHLSLAMLSQTGGLETHWRAWGSLATTYSILRQPKLAILAGKQAVKILQVIRSNNIALERNLRKSYLKDKKRVYRKLASTLIKQDRSPEAEQVMRMLKEERYFDYIQRDSKNDSRITKIRFTTPEQMIVNQLDHFHTQLAPLEKEYKTLHKTTQADEAYTAQLIKVKTTLEEAQAEFIDYLSRLEDQL